MVRRDTVRRDLPDLVCLRRLDDDDDDDDVGAPGRREVDRPGPGTNVPVVVADGRFGEPVPDAQGDEVYLARRTTDGADVAVRIYGRPLRTDRDRHRFDQEVRALTRLSVAPHVARVDGGGVLPDGRPYLVTEFCGGGSLREHVAAVGRLTPDEASRIGAKLAGALMAAHRRDIFHRNLTPANVLISDAGEPMLANFTLLSVVMSDPAPPIPLTRRAFGAPEAYLPELMSSAADIYSLGATLYALLAGTPSAEGQPLIVDGESLADLPQVPYPLMAALRRAMAHDPRDRYPTAEAFHTALSPSDPPILDGYLPDVGAASPRLEGDKGVAG